MDETGFEPMTFRMQSERATNCATRPSTLGMVVVAVPEVDAAGREVGESTRLPRPAAKAGCRGRLPRPAAEAGERHR